MAAKDESLTDLAREVNTALVKLGKANWRREFNEKLWACNRSAALALIAQYRAMLARLAEAAGWEDFQQTLSPIRS